jgi:hypothetical protein
MAVRPTLHRHTLSRKVVRDALLVIHVNDGWASGPEFRDLIDRPVEVSGGRTSGRAIGSREIQACCGATPPRRRLFPSRSSANVPANFEYLSLTDCQVLLSQSGGKIQLQQLNCDDVSVIASGGRLQKGILVGALGDVQRSAKRGTPVYRNLRHFR